MCISLKINIFVLFFFLPLCVLIGLFSYNIANIGDGCISQKCNYVDNGLFECNTSVIGNDNFNCTHSFPCPKDKNTTCYIYSDDSCPLIGYCINKHYSIQATVLGLISVLLAVILLVFIIHQNKGSTYDEI